MRPTRTRTIFCVGLDGLRQSLDGLAPCSDGYPPYNVVSLPQTSTSNAALRLTFAVAGFAPHQLEVFVTECHLVVRGEQNNAGEDRIYMHRGVAARRFERVFLLDHGLEVRDANLADGLLSVTLTRAAEAGPSTKIEISARDS